MKNFDKAKSLVLIAAMLAAGCAPAATPEAVATSTPTMPPNTPTPEFDPTFNATSELACAIRYLPWLIPVNHEGVKNLGEDVIGCLTIFNQEFIGALTQMNPGKNNTVSFDGTILYFGNDNYAGILQEPMTANGAVDVQQGVRNKSYPWYDARVEKAVSDFFADPYGWQKAEDAYKSNGDLVGSPVLIPKNRP